MAHRTSAFAELEMSSGGRGIKGPKKNFENTYRTEPKAIFCAVRAERIIREYMESQLEDVKYDPTSAMTLAKSLSAEIKERVKDVKVLLPLVLSVGIEIVCCGSSFYT